MHKPIFTLLIFFSLVSGLKAASNTVSLSDKAEISILTCAPGEELYSVFGHSAIRVSDPKNEIDLAFNYGTFDFNTPFFYLKFGHGSLDYMLSVSSFKRFMREYFVEGRSVWEQELALSPQQKQDIFESLIENAQPENRAYKYDFFYDNCATRVAFAVIEQLPGKPDFTVQLPADNLSFRDAIHPYLNSKPWTKLGIDLILGAPADARTDSLTIMFLPDYLMEQFSGIQFSMNGTQKGLVKGTELILDFSDKSVIKSEQLSPVLIIWFLAIVVIILSLGEHTGYIGRLKWLDIPLFLVGGVGGLVVTYLAFISDHFVTGSNWNLLWVNPIWFFLVTNGNNTIVNAIKKLQTLFLLIFLISLPFSQQYIPAEFIPLVLIFLFRLIRPFSFLVKDK
ncbi:Lnb N-terminal periplasmic domain-containing protein [Marinilabilia rubra]|uniref:Lnb N-terminal periplasmic domain-containing protein n=1 Tax=Marinilabilia rubra TaxID=2162893 RepID=UPI001E2D1D19|nr:DUF4105 domain-containing protein [Marinilabilia rubra]